MQITLIVPFHSNLSHLEAALGAIRVSAPGAQVVVAADGAIDDCRPLARAHAAEVMDIPGPSGPAAARNAAARQAAGEVLIFVDADVVVAPDAVARICRVLSDEPEIAAVFGAYDHSPPAGNFMSQFKNLAHCYVHETGNPEASTFWAGLGAVRRHAFETVGGFDERFVRPSVEDIDLGYRLTSRGFRIRLDPEVRGTHLKRWTLRSCVATDVLSRGLPWVQLIHRFGMGANDLNLKRSLRWSVVISYLLFGSLIGLLVTPASALATALLLGVLVWLNFDYYRWCAARRGVGFAVRVIPVHVLHHLCNGVSYVAGTLLHWAGHRGLLLPGTLAPGPWIPRRQAFDDSGRPASGR
jgi:GT2 family glycosyltransferase